ncbi:tetratricopeptide repeat protein [Chryseotalea sanaruensis]|uniref:histidine kinase n=1 Tax=Chryseotalea sanaruensis TaxID=2482724 RepID=A0A401U5D8_9BACT|nr:tetratricopeptide repeat protein [Chryseotalea sanaruensis]GCC50107.1 tetratricopeptide repeat protein [Chryseotalea sanaruensis]
MKGLVPFLLLFSICIPLSGQVKIDSLKDLLNDPKQRDNFKRTAHILSIIGWEFGEMAQPDSAIVYYKRVLLHQNEADKPVLALSYNALGVAFQRRGLFDSSIHYYEGAYLLYNELGDSANSTTVDTNLSGIYKNKGLYEKALEYSFNALEKLERMKPDRALASCYNTIGAIYSNTGDFHKALIYYRKSLNVRKLIGYQKGIGQSLNNIGEVHISLVQYDSALFYLKKSLKIREDIGEKAPVVLNNLGEVQLKLNNYNEAETYFQQSLILQKAAYDQSGQLEALLSILKIKILKGDVTQAEKIIKEIDGLVYQVGSLKYLKQFLELKVKVFDLKKDFKNAFQSSQDLLVIKDSLLTKEKAEALLNMQIRYETEQKEQQIDLLEKEQVLQKLELEKNKLWIEGLIISALLLLVIALLVFLQFKSSQRNKKRNDFLLKELNHRVKNNLQILSSLLTLQSQELTDASAISAVKSSEGRVNAMALIHKKLYTENQNQQINIKEYISELTQYLAQSYGFNNRGLVTHLDIDEIQLEVDKAIPLGLVINELLSNAFKYAFDGKDKPELTVNLNFNGTHALIVLIQDNGSGMPENTESSASFGLKMVRTLVKELKGKMTIKIETGTQILLQIPI